MDEAEKKAYEMKVGAFNYSDAILAKLQEKISDINGIIEDNRQELKRM